jgi:UDP-2,3-diacylglucosamine pyrophosphatase LpxH
MRIAALSDLHIGARARADVFRRPESELIDFLDELEEAHDRIVLLGDVFQAEHGWFFGSRIARAELARAARRMPRFLRKLGSDRYIYIHGNHDAVARSRLGARTDWRIEADGFAVYFIHGHQFDPLLRYVYPLARSGTWLSGRLRFAGLRQLPDWLEHRDITIKDQRFRGPGGPYGRAAAALMRQHRANAVVMGHTHVPDRITLSDGIYANTGSCSVGRRMFVSIDTVRRSTELIRL